MIVESRSVFRTQVRCSIPGGDKQTQVEVAINRLSHRQGLSPTFNFFLSVFFFWWVTIFLLIKSLFDVWIYRWLGEKKIVYLSEGWLGTRPRGNLKTLSVAMAKFKNLWYAFLSLRSRNSILILFYDTLLIFLGIYFLNFRLFRHEIQDFYLVLIQENKVMLLFLN